ncbi:MAG: integrase [Acidobacteria bacterium]|nr:MAG: integrase [Acidobacteriota bacterium]
MVSLACAVVAYLRFVFLPRHKLALEAVALRQQLATFKRKQPRPKVDRLDRLFWIVLSRLWKGWSEALIIGKPETMVSRHRAGFRRLWRWRSQRRRPGRPMVDEQIRQLIRRLKAENPTWGAPRVHGELLQLGFEISEPTVSRYLQNLNGCRDVGRAKRWLAFFNNHREVIAAFDFFTVPNLTFRTLYCFFVIEHGRRRILHFNVTEHPTRDWIVQQLREALPLPRPNRYVLFDRDAKFGGNVVEFLQASAMKPIRTSDRSPWQNGAAERWVGSVPREELDHVIPLNDQHLRRLGREYIAYYHEDRTHIGLEKMTPVGRPGEPRPTEPRQPRALPHIGGFHHRDTWPTAA